MAYVTILSGREREVLALVAEGLTNKQIAQRLRISSNTVQGYVSLALNKLGAANRREAIVLATQQGLTPQIARPPRFGSAHDLLRATQIPGGTPGRQ